MANKKQQTQVTAADLRFRHLPLAKKLAINMLDEMQKEKLGVNDIPVVLNDLCKFVVLSEAYARKESALRIVQRFTDLNTDITCWAMRIVANNYGKGLESLEEETDEPKNDQF